MTYGRVCTQARLVQHRDLMYSHTFNRLLLWPEGFLTSNKSDIQVVSILMHIQTTPGCEQITGNEHNTRIVACGTHCTDRFRDMAQVQVDAFISIQVQHCKLTEQPYRVPHTMATIRNCTDVHAIALAVAAALISSGLMPSNSSSSRLRASRSLCRTEST